MKIENDKIVEATKKELFKLYLKYELDDIMEFDEYLRHMKNAGCVVIKE